jgi:hypothetical protein
MGLSIIERPQGVILGTCVAATIHEDYATYATIETTSAHNLNTGDWVYISSFVEDYNGFWQVQNVSAIRFFLLNPDGSYVPWVVDADITYCPQQSLHSWSAIHLPIVYKIKSDLYPTNNFDVFVTVSSYANASGYTKLTLSASLTINELEYIQISGALSSQVNGIFQVIDKSSSSVITIDLAYDSSLSFSGGMVILYYSNYHVIVNIYAGLPATHSQYVKKPYQLAGTFRFIPDSNNEVMFSVAELVKAYIEISNNMIQSSWPLNLDAFSGFYITVQESYDTSDGYTITTFEGEESNDINNFEGVAINSKLEFKNQYSGFMTEFIGTWLTKFIIPKVWPGYLFDISFINIFSSLDVIITIVKKLNGSTISTETQTISSPDYGVIRQIISAESSYDQYCIKASTLGSSGIPETTTNVTLPALSSGVNNAGSGIDWTTGASPNVALPYTTGIMSNVSDIWSENLAFIAGNTYSFNVNWTSSDMLALNITISFYIYILDSSNNIIESSVTDVTTGATRNSTITFVATDPDVKYGIKARLVKTGATVGGGNITITINSITATTTTPGTPPIPAQDITDEICLSIVNECTTNAIQLTWLNNLGGFDYWVFGSGQPTDKEYIRDITDSGETKVNLFSEWPKSYGQDANTIRRQTFRNSNKKILVHSQYLTLDELQAIEYIKSSILVEMVNSRSDKRRVIVDTDSWSAYKDNDKLYNLSFTISYTDDIPSQRL